MTNTAIKGTLPTTFTPLANRDLANLAADMAAVSALGQGAVNVEMFTLPLYMCAMSSIQGTHEINSKDTQYYQGRVWPGMSPTAALNPTTNQQAYNTIFSVFIQEMLHLQLAANLSAVLGVKPRFFDGTLLENETTGWGCYGPENTVIPHIIELRDTTNATAVKVNLGELNADQITLFKCIEQSHEQALENIKPEAREKYFPEVPFAGWTAPSTEKDLPLFGTIGWMYYCLVSYLAMEYTDGENLWEKMFKSEHLNRQRDLFNMKSTSHAPEYPGMPGGITKQDAKEAAVEGLAILSGICDQGEGGIGNILDMVTTHFQARGEVESGYVHPRFQPDNLALQEDYPSYDAHGNETGGSADGFARTVGDTFDHWSRFDSLSALIEKSDFLTWAQWFAAGNTWQAADLTDADYDPATAPKNIPSPREVAEALNELRGQSDEKAILSHIVVGAIEGINRVLTDSWGDSNVQFPYPSMAGSGDRMSFYWAVFGEAPDLSRGIGTPSGDQLHHACQALSYGNPGADCAAQEVFHTCRGSNACKAQGGCGFAQSTQGGGGCGSQRVQDAKRYAGNSCGGPTPTAAKYTAPNDNQCGAFGGCAVPISASQLYPHDGMMELVDVLASDRHPLGQLPFQKGESVYDIAWRAYATVMESHQQDPGEKPTPNALRTALPPST